MYIVTIKAHMHDNKGSGADESEERLRALAGVLGRVEACEKRASRMRRASCAVVRGAEASQPPNGINQRTKGAISEWDRRMSCELTTSGTSPPPRSQSAARRRRRGLGPAATRMPWGRAMSRWSSQNAEGCELKVHLRRDLKVSMSQAVLRGRCTRESAPRGWLLFEEAGVRHRHRTMLACIAWCSLREDPREHCLGEVKQ